MSKKSQNINGFAQDIIGRFTLSNRTHNSQCKYHIDRMINGIQFNTDMKLKRIEELEEMSGDMIHRHQQHGELLDQDKLLQNENDIQWQKDQVAINEDFKAYLQEAFTQLFPEVDKQAEQMDNIIAKYSTTTKKKLKAV